MQFEKVQIRQSDKHTGTMSRERFLWCTATRGASGLPAVGMKSLFWCGDQFSADGI